jgi:hypothetical protein
MQEAELEIGLPIKNNNIYYLSFSCDLEKFNSAPLAIKKSHIKIARNEIELYLVYTLTKEENIDKIKLGKLNTGDYRIYYIDKDKTKYFIKEINIE